MYALTRTKSIYMDMPCRNPGPKAGDYVVTVGKRGVGTVYFVVSSYRVRRKDPAAYPRYQMRVRVVNELPGDLGTAKVFELRWYPRKSIQR